MFAFLVVLCFYRCDMRGAVLDVEIQSIAVEIETDRSFLEQVVGGDRIGCIGTRSNGGLVNGRCRATRAKTFKSFHLLLLVE